MANRIFQTAIIYEYTVPGPSVEVEDMLESVGGSESVTGLW